MALDAALATKCNRVNLYTDSAYVVAGANRRHPAVRQLVRRNNAVLWHLFDQLRTRLERCGTEFVVWKVAAHGEDEDQDPRLTAGNDVADTVAKAAVDMAAVNFGWGDDGLQFCIAGASGMVMGDPRATIRQRGEAVALEHWVSLRSEGRVARVIHEEGKVAMGALRKLTSVVHLAQRSSLGVLGERPKHLSLAYQTPSRWYRGKPHIFFLFFFNNLFIAPKAKR